VSRVDTMVSVSALEGMTLEIVRMWLLDFIDHNALEVNRQLGYAV